VTNVDTPTLSQSFQYNAIGNVTYNSQIGAYSYPAPGAACPHAVLGAGSRSYAYNGLGRMTNRNGTLLQWNGQGLPSSSGNIAFFYDGLGQRVKKISGGETTRYVDSDYEVGPDGTVTKYLQEGKQVGSQFFALHRDHLGSIQSVTDGSGGEVRHQWHKPFGDQHLVSGAHEESRGWIGEREEETELVYLNARYYDPEIGRFISADAFLSRGQGMNRFSYSVNNPVTFSDPSGLCHDGYSRWALDEKGEGYRQWVCPTGDVHYGPSSPYPGSAPGSPGQPPERHDRHPRPCEQFGFPCREDRPPRQPGNGEEPPEPPATPPKPPHPDRPPQEEDHQNEETKEDLRGEDPRGKALPPGWRSYHDVEQRLAAFWDGVIPFYDPFNDLYQDCPECWISAEIGEWTRNTEIAIALGGQYGNNNPFVRIGPGWKRFPDGSVRQIWRIASGGRLGKGGPKLPWHWHWP